MSLVPRWLLALVRPIERLLAANLRDSLDENEVVVRTSRYLRLAMVCLVLGLAASLFFELNRVRNLDGRWCVLDSISAYYYTPVHAFFVGALVSIGISLVAIRGNTALEDMLLNFAGVCAPFVALVPYDGVPTTCHPVLDSANRDLNVANNVGALFVVAAAALVALGVLAILQLRSHQRPDPAGLISYFVVLVCYAAALVVFLTARGWFTAHLHTIAAVTMFALLAVNTLVNGYNLYHTRQHQDPALQPLRRVVPRFNSYTAIGTLMVLAAVVIPIFLRPHWEQWIFGLEATEIGLFAAFWVRQTIELWDEGLRPPPAAPAPVDRGLANAGSIG